MALRARDLQELPRPQGQEPSGDSDQEHQFGPGEGHGSGGVEHGVSQRGSESSFDDEAGGRAADGVNVAPQARRLWSEPAAWPDGSVPSEDSSVVVQGHVVIDGDATAATVRVAPGSTLEFAAERSISLTLSGNLVVEGTLVMQPRGVAHDHLIRFVDIDETRVAGGGHSILDTDVGVWFVKDGQANLSGTKRLAWTRSTIALKKGGTTIELQDPPTGWTIGDEIAIAPTSRPGTTGHSDGYSKGRINSISGKTVVVDTAFDYEHPKVNAAWGAEVMNLTRNVRIEGTPDRRAHVLFSHTLRPHVLRNVELRHLGPRQETGEVGHDDPFTSGVPGRYPLHFHHNGHGSRGTIVENVVVRNSGNRAFVAHGSHGITFEGTIAHDVFETPYWWDRVTHRDGRAFWEPPSNDVSYRRAIASLVKTDPPFRGYLLAGFELGHGNRLSITDSVAVGVQGNVNASGFNWPEASPAEQGTLSFSDHWEFTDNVAHNNRVHGTFGWQNNDDPRHIIDSSVMYHNGVSGVDHGAYKNSYTYRNLQLFGNGDAGFKLHAQGTIILENLVLDGGGFAPHGFSTSERHIVPAPGAILRNSTFRGYTEAAVHIDSRNVLQLDIVNPRFQGTESSWFLLADHVPPDSRIRVQLADGTAFQLHPYSSGIGTPVGAWNARRETIEPFA